ncbi:hypothetical protein [Nocardioides taihuensis]|jgi:hypothetical protein|uniref:DUF4386 family protein n=1 Tax=Nocardioides taihuensis TaxID=1835606 RepID=A0ABW0BDM4_9ACTN
MTVTVSPTRPNDVSGSTDRGSRLVCVAGSLLVSAAVLLCTVSGSSGEAVVHSLRDSGVPLQVGAGVAAFGAAALLVAASRLGHGRGPAGSVMTLAGAGVALTTALYYAVFGAAVATADVALDTPHDGLGEATLLLLNVADFARYAPGLALVAAAVWARRSLPSGLWVPAAVLALLAAVPWTAWVAAVLIPLWLGVAGAVVRRVA